MDLIFLFNVLRIITAIYLFYSEFLVELGNQAYGDLNVICVKRYDTIYLLQWLSLYHSVCCGPLQETVSTSLNFKHTFHTI